MLVTNRKRNLKNGQAVIELVPAIFLFFTVIGAGFSYYRVMRVAQMRQESVRNLLFQKINYSGTLTSPLNQPGRGIVTVGTAPSERRPAGVTENFNCLGVAPESVIKSAGDTNIMDMAKGLSPVGIRTYAVIYRRPGGRACSP